MPIGKNSIKRVVNNGYSKVASSAPDMENSTVAPKANDTKKKALPKTAASKTAPKSAKKAESPVERAKKKVEETKKAASKQSQKKPVTAKATKMQTAKPTAKNDSPKREGEGYVNLGGILPIYLL